MKKRRKEEGKRAVGGRVLFWPSRGRGYYQFSGARGRHEAGLKSLAVSCFFLPVFFSKTCHEDGLQKDS